MNIDNSKNSGFGVNIETKITNEKRMLCVSWHFAYIYLQIRILATLNDLPTFRWCLCVAVFIFIFFVRRKYNLLLKWTRHVYPHHNNISIFFFFFFIYVINHLCTFFRRLCGSVSARDTLKTNRNEFCIY